MLDIAQIKDELRKENIRKAVISSPFKKSAETPFKITAELISVKNEKCFQFSYFIDKKVIHQNVALGEASDKIIDEMYGKFKQCLVIADSDINIMLNKKNEFHAKRSSSVARRLKPVSHDKEKNYILKDGVRADWAVLAGLMSDDGKVFKSMQKKFKQVNKFLEMLAAIEDRLPENAVIADMGCGKSYLTFAVYHYFNIIKNKNVTIRGFDLKKDVVENCNKAARTLGYDKITFEAGDIANITSDQKIDMLITLHACDTATDIALYHAVRLGCSVIMSVPCCQHELFPQIENELLSPLLEYGILKERFSALLTDAIRALCLELCGYRVNVEEFIETEHTPKNIMIKAIKTGRKLSKENYDKLERLLCEFSADPTIYKLLKDYFTTLSQAPNQRR